MIYAHSLPGRPSSDWESLPLHLKEVAALAAEFASVFGWAEVARVLGILHDIGKCSDAFLRYINQAAADSRSKGPDHSTAGAREAVAAYGPQLGRMLAYAIAGHHGGLSDDDRLGRRLTGKSIEPYSGWEAQTGPLPGRSQMMPAKALAMSAHAGFSRCFLTRMLFSCLVDADWLATERFYAAANNETVERGRFLGIEPLRDRLRAYMATFRTPATTPLDTLRAEVLGHAVGKAALAPGLFTLTVPTGGGKTLASLSFALEHAVANGMRRVVYVSPFTAIIDQTAEVFRTALGTRDDILEHHASFDWDQAATTAAADDEGPDGVLKLRRASENWDAPVIVTTAVQFFESLFGNGRARCRKLHNLAGAVIVLDEAQTMPLRLLHPCLAALDELPRNYGASVVLCTATQPAIRTMQDKFPHGLDIPDARELAPNPPELYARLRRVRVEHAGEVADEALAERFAACPQMLCIVNSRAHAAELFQRIRSLEGAVHLTTLMVPRHRQKVLAAVKQRLLDGCPVRLVATSLVEAGVDFSFPEVWRALTGLDSIAQAAGRCNREGKLALGRTVVFKAAGRTPPHALTVLAQAAEAVLARHEDPLTLDAVRDYFQHLYWNRGHAFDAALLDGKPFPILEAIAAGGPNLAFPFETVARAFRMIDEAMEGVVVPWREDQTDTTAASLLAKIAASERPQREDLRALQQHMVPIPQRARNDWLARKALRVVHRGLDNALLTFDDDALYDPVSGLRLTDPTYRSAESNIIA